jgi:hypothetical protein
MALEEDEVPPFLVRRPLPSKSGVLLEDTGRGNLKLRDVILEWPTLAVCKNGTTELVYPVDVHHCCIIYSRPNKDCLVNGQRVCALQIVPRPRPPGMTGIDKALTFYASSNKERDEWAAVLRKHAVHVDIENGFLLEGILGQGNYASVYKARDIFSDRDVALKVIEKNRLSEEERKLLADEVLVSKAADNYFCVKTVEFIELFMQYVLVVEYMEGGDLYERVVCEQVRNMRMRGETCGSPWHETRGWSC